MIEVEPLTRAHLAAFEPETPMRGDVPEDQFGQAAVGLKDGKPLAVCFVGDNFGKAEIGLWMSAEARRYPITLHRLARQMLTGLHASGYQCITTTAETPRAAAWLRRLGFEENNGAFEKWHSPQHF